MYKRSSNIEVIRILAMCMIILYHNLLYGGWNFDSVTTNKVIVDCLSMGGKLGVNLFACITGYFYNKSWSIGKVLKIELQVLFVSWGCLITYVFMEPFTMREDFLCCIKNVMPTIFNQYWFVSAYIMLLLLEPFINVFISRLSKRQIELFLMLMMVLWCIIPTITLQTKDPFGYNQYIGLVIMYIVGAYIKKYEKWINITTNGYLLCVVVGGGADPFFVASSF